MVYQCNEKGKCGNHGSQLDNNGRGGFGKGGIGKGVLTVLVNEVVTNCVVCTVCTGRP